MDEMESYGDLCQGGQRSFKKKRGDNGPERDEHEQREGDTPYSLSPFLW